MSIDIKFDAKMKTTKIYSLNSTDRKFVDETFDKLHAQKRMKYIIQSTPHDYFIFVVWRIVFEFNNSKRKDRVVIDIRNFNKIVIIDTYFMLLQFDITSIVADCQYIFVFDVVSFFYQ